MAVNDSLRSEPLHSSALRPRGGGLLGPILGFSYPFRAIRLLQTHRTLRPFVVMPVIINGLVGIGLYTAGLWWGRRVIDGWTTTLINWIEPAWLDRVVQALMPVIQGGLLVFLFVVLGLLLLQFGSILGAPFYGQLTEKLESLYLGPDGATPQALDSGNALQDIWRAILFELKKLLLIVGGGGLLFFANFVPGFGPLITTGGSLSLAVMLVCLDMLDAPLERRRLGFRQKLSIILRCLPASGSFGLICLGLVSIPLMNLLAIPLCVSAGTLFFCDRILDQQSG